MGDTLNPLMDYGGTPSIEDEANLESLYSKIDTIGGFWNLVKQMKVWQDIFQI